MEKISKRTRSISRSLFGPPIRLRMEDAIYCDAAQHSPPTSLQYLKVICRCSAFQCLVRIIYRKAPKVTAFRNFGRLPPWCRRPQKMTYHLYMTKTAIVPNLPEEGRKTLMEHGILPHESSAKDRFCVMCPVKRGSPRLLPCCL